MDYIKTFFFSSFGVCHICVCEQCLGRYGLTTFGYIKISLIITSGLLSYVVHVGNTWYTINICHSICPWIVLSNLSCRLPEIPFPPKAVLCYSVRLLPSKSFSTMRCLLRRLLFRSIDTSSSAICVDSRTMFFCYTDFSLSGGCFPIFLIMFYTIYQKIYLNFNEY